MSERSPNVEVFCSYAREDETWLRKLETHLSLLQRQGHISLWNNRCISPGTDRVRAIDTHLETASVILLLVSADFLASDYCYGTEMDRALERQKAGEAQVIPILVRPVDWKNAPFAHLQVLPTGTNPIASWSDSDSALADVARGIRKAIEQLPLRTNIIPENKQAASKEGNEHDEMNPPPKPQRKEQEPYIGSYQHRMETFVRQQYEFDLALVKAMPGKGSYTPTYIQAKNKKEIDRVLSSLADACEACDLRWFSGYQWGPACPIKRLAEEVWLIQHDECKIIDLWIYRHPTLERQYVLLHLAPQPPFSLDSSDADSDRDEAGYYKGRYVTREEYDDGYAEIDEEVIEIQGAELRSRNLKDDFKVLAPVYSVYNDHANRQQTVEVDQTLRAAGKIDQTLLQLLERLERPEWMEWSD